MALALFDLDNTLLAGDSDYLWGVFLVEKGVVDGDLYERENNRFYKEYLEGRLDIEAWLKFSLKPLKENALEHLYQWREEFLRSKIDPIILPTARLLIQKHRQAGDILLIITATNSFVTAPIAERLGIDNLIASDPEMIDGRFTGKVAGDPSFHEGKVKRLKHWLQGRNLDLSGSYFYSDSHNDIPLLKLVDNPIAVDPDDTLVSYAKDRQWPIISMRTAYFTQGNES